MTNELVLLLKMFGKRFLHGFFLSGPFVISLLIAIATNIGELFYIVLIVGAIVGLPWSLMFLPLLGVTNQRMDAFFMSLVPGHSEWDAVIGLAITTVFLGLHINGMLFVYRMIQQSRRLGEA